MTEDTKTTETKTISPEFIEFMLEQGGGLKATEQKFRQHSIRMAFNKRQANEVTMGEIFDHIESQGGSSWLRGISIVDFLGLFTKPGSDTPTKPKAKAKAKTKTKAKAKKVNGAEDGRTIRAATNLQARIDKFMTEFEKTPWIRKPDIGVMLGLKSPPTVDKLVNEALNRGLIKKHRGRTMMYAKATETCPPPT